MFSKYRNVSRRRFLGGVAGITAAGFAAASASGAVRSFSIRNSSPTSFNQGAAGRTQIRVDGPRIQVETATLSATIDQGSVTSLKSKAGGQEFIAPFDTAQSAALQLLYRSEETVAIDESRFGSIACRQVSDNRAEVLFHSWDGDGILTVTADPETGDLILEPSACSSRPGVRACRWNIRGLRPDLELVAPFFQGIKLRMDDALIKDSRWPWPVSWEAGLAILQSASGGFWVHTRDDRYRYKALKIGTKSDPFSLGFDTEAYGPIDDNLAAGGLAWRVNVFQGDWKVPAERYRDWLWGAYNLNREERRRRDWIHDIRFAVSWCPGDPGILDALAEKLKPGRVLLHFPDWRTDPYDENYPTFVASDKGRRFVEKGRAMGFHVMPHFNSIDIDPTHPVYAQVRDFQYRDIERKTLQGWSWYKGRSIGVPESNTNRLGHRDMKVMIKVHPGLSIWRSILAGNVANAAGDLSLETAFLDVTLNTYNLHNCLVEGITPTEGMKRLIDEVGSVGKGLVIGGEGLNEITAQGQSFGQVHLFRSWQSSAKDLERAGGCAFNEFLLGKLCRGFGYSGLGGRNSDEELRMRIHEEHGAIPTVTIRSANEIREPNAAVKRLFDRAK